MARGWTKFGLLLWKNWVLQKRHVVQTAVEVLVPVLLSCLLVLIRSLVDPEVFPEPTTFSSFTPKLFPAWHPLPPQLQNWTIAWSPNSSAQLDAIMEDVGVSMRMNSRGFASKDELNDYMTSSLGPTIMSYTLAGVIFDDEEAILADPSKLPANMTATLRFPGESRFSPSTASGGFNLTDSPSQIYSWTTQFIFPLFPNIGPRQRKYDFGGFSPGYWPEQFLALQESISVALINQLTENKAELPAVRLQRFPYPAYLSDPILQALQAFMPVIIMLSFVYTCISTVKVITTEKERQLKEAMKIMGLPNWLHWLAWFIKTLAFLVISVVLITILLKVPWYPGQGYSVFTNSDGTLVFVFLLLYILASITYCFMISVFFSKANTAATVAGLIWFLSYAPYNFMYPFYSSIPTGNKVAACLLSNTAMAYGFQIMIMNEGTSEGSQWSNVWEAVSPNDDFYLGYVLVMLVIDTALYWLIAVYVEAVFPGDFGVPQPWNYFAKKSFWLGEADGDGNEQAAALQREGDEPEPTQLKAGVQIRHLTKNYGKKTAVQDLNLNMYEGQITVLLGHNGAGKTTTMSMLTGMITPSGGSAVVSGYDIRTNMQAVRDSLGLCPQHNVLFEEMTVREHLYFFGKLKGLDGQALEDEIMKYIKLMELLPKENKQSCTLSGGMQRKLAACVALCGNSKVVLFDEPTSGMDPTARRALWDLLQLEKKGRTVLLSTHFMDEADLLGDRIAIMAGGKLQCVGSSFFLKKKYGEGYRLVIVKGDNCNIAGVTDLLRKFVPDLNVSQNIGTELSYLLREELSEVFEPMFQQLETQKDSLGVLSYGMSVTTMEEVFMKAGKDAAGVMENSGAKLDQNDVAFKDKSSDNGSSYIGDHSSTTALDESGQSQRLLTGLALSRNQLYAMFMKKAIYTKRTWLLSFIQTFLVVFFLVLTIIIMRMWTGFADLPSLTLSMNRYGPEAVTSACLLSDDPKVTEFYKAYTSDYPDGLTELPTNGDMSAYILEQSEKNLAAVSKHFILGATFSTVPLLKTPRITAWFNNQPLHALPLALSQVYNSLLRKETGESDRQLTIVNFPLPFRDSSQFSQLAQGDNMGFQIAFNIAFGMAFATSFYVLFAVRERESKSKLLQFVSGVEVLAFWGSALIWDLLTFLLPIFSTIIVFLVFQEDGYRSGEDLGRHLLVLLLFNWASMPLMYLFSFLFTIPSTGFTRVSMFNILGGCAMFMTVTIIEYPLLDLADVAAAMDWAFLIIPHYNLAMSFRSLYNAQAYGKICKKTVDFCGLPGVFSPCCKVPEQCGPTGCVAWVENYFSFEKPGIGRHLVFYAVDGVVFITILLLIEYRVFDRLITKFRGIGPKPNAISVELTDELEDYDVAAERHKIHKLGDHPEGYNLLLRDVTKYYANFLAVNQLCLGVKRGECFGLLGVNGAGKTTTFKMLTGDERISSGEAFVNGYSLITNMKEVHQLIGYCPQFDALIDDLTGRETLTMFCLLRGIPHKQIPGIVDQLAQDLLFTQHIDKKVKEYSGGNKRKLSTAVALVGDPPVIYLDEPTTGMDPVAKRHLWNVICKVRDGGKVIVLTSHSMEECEALCTRSAIMVNGNFKCLGSTQHLKNKFAEGYTLSVKVKKLSANDTRIQDYINQSFPGAVLREEYQGLLSYYIQNPTITWSRMFGMMEAAKKTLDIEDYALGQTSLEQVFLTFTKKQHGEHFDPQR